MNLAATISVYGYGTSEGVVKEWDTRGRGRKAPPSKSPAPSGANESFKDSLLKVAKDDRSRQLIDKMASTIEKNGGMDSRIYTQVPMRFMKEDLKTATMLHAVAAYNTETQGMIVGVNRGDDAAEIPMTEVAIHEYGHHLYASFLATANEQRAFNTPMGNTSAQLRDWDSDKADAAVKGMKQEYQSGG